MRSFSKNLLILDDRREITTANYAGKDAFLQATLMQSRNAYETFITTLLLIFGSFLRHIKF